MRWLVVDYVARNIPQLVTPDNWIMSNPHTRPLGGIGAANYKSFSQFQDDVSNGAIHPLYNWVLYDPESWEYTPAAEQQDPWTAMERFGQFAHANGYRVIMTPARDLGNVKTTTWQKLPGESLNAWYDRTQLATTAARHGDAIDIQAQALTLDTSAYQQFTAAAASQARTANPYATRLAGISTRYGTAQQMYAAAKTVSVDGYWLNVPGPQPDYDKAKAFLKLYNA